MIGPGWRRWFSEGATCPTMRQKRVAALRGEKICLFQAQYRKLYVITINFQRDPDELNLAEPKLVAESVQDYEGFTLELQGSRARWSSLRSEYPDGIRRRGNKR